MIEIKSNIRVIVQAKLEQIKELRRNPDPIVRTVAMTVMPALKKRVHVDGLDATGSKIGTYSKGYMVVRTGNFQSATRYVRGEKAGQFYEKKKQTEADAGYRTKGNYKGAPRRVYNRSADTTVILSLTRQMENDLSVVATGTGYGIGYLNSFNHDKAMWCEQTYGKKILSKLTIDELQLAQTTAQEFTAAYLKQTA